VQTRSRLRLSTYTGYRTEKFGGHVTNGNTYIANSEQCDDVTGINAGDNQPFTVTRIERSGGLINGTEKSNLTGYIWNYYPCAYVEDSWTTSHLSISGQPSNGSLATQLAARTQPFRAEALSWEYMSELSSLGSLARFKYKDALRRLFNFVPMRLFNQLSRAAKYNLLVRFGLIPLISDINVLLQFQKRVDGRVEEMKRLYEKRGLRRTVHLWDGSSHAIVANQTIQSQGVLLHARITKSTTVKLRGHIRWRGIFPVGKTDERLHRMASDAVSGTNLDASAIYNMMPWSWLIDYFLNLGNLIKAGSNSFDVYHEQVRIMEHRRTRTASSNHDWDNQGTGFLITCSPFFVTSESKKRTLATPTLNAQESILTNGQLSILGSLAVLLVK